MGPLWKSLRMPNFILSNLKRDKLRNAWITYVTPWWIQNILHRLETFRYLNLILYGNFPMARKMWQNQSLRNLKILWLKAFHCLAYTLQVKFWKETFIYFIHQYKKDLSYFQDFYHSCFFVWIQINAWVTYVTPWWIQNILHRLEIVKTFIWILSCMPIFLRQEKSDKNM